MAATPHENATKHIYSAAHFTINVDGIKELPTLRSVEGGGAQAEIITYQMGEKGDNWRQLGKPKYSDIKMTMGLAEATPFWSWIEATLKGKGARKSGAITAANFNYVEMAKRKFEEAMIVGLGFPKWDAAAKEQANLTVTMAVEKVIFEKAGGAKIEPKDQSEAQQKQILSCNFTFDFEGYDTIRVTKIDPMEIKVKTIEHHHGSRIEPAKIPGRIEWPNLVFYVPESDAPVLRDLHNQHMAGQERKPGQPGLSALLTFHNNRKQQKGSMEFKGIRVFHVSAEKGDASSEEMKLTKVECTLESIEKFKLG